MKPKRWMLVLVVLMALVFLAGLSLRGPREPTYQGKTVSVWFREYAYSSNAPPPGLYSFPYSANSRLVRWVGGVSNIVPGMIPPGSQSTPWPGDPSVDALQALGSNAIPYLAQRLHDGRLDRAYAIAFRNLPAFIQRKLPNPGEQQWFRMRALDALGDLGDAAKGATPALLELLRQGEPRLRSRVLTTLRRVYADGFEISGLLLRLGAEKRYAEVLEIAFETKWQGREVAQLFGEILQATNTARHHDAIKLLEDSGERAAPALEGILAALRSSDGEVRYLAARTLENISRKTLPAAQPQVAAALEASLHDEKDTVRDVARRALAKLNNSAESPTAATSPQPPGEEEKYEGKTIEQWFQEYVAGAETRIPPHTPPLMNGELLWPSSRQTKPEPSWLTFQTLGEKAVPCLVRHLGVSVNATNPQQSRLEREQAIELVHRLGMVARRAAPALLALLPQADEAEAEAVYAAIRAVKPDADTINRFLLDMNKQGRTADVLRFAQQCGWSSPEVAQILGGLLSSPDSERCHDALVLLEAAGVKALPAVDQIAGALKRSDHELRYLAARSLAHLATNSAAAREALLRLADDQNEMVRKVARQAIR